MMLETSNQKNEFTVETQGEIKENNHLKIVRKFT